MSAPFTGTVFGNVEEQQKDRARVIERLTKLNELIGKEADREKKRWLLTEQTFYMNNGQHCDWGRYRQRLEAIDAKEREATKQREAAAAAFEAEKKRLADEQEKKLREQYALETDPFEVWRRSKSERTF